MWCDSDIHVRMQCFMLIEIVTVKGYGNIHSHHLRLVAIGYEYAMLP